MKILRKGLPWLVLGTKRGVAVFMLVMGVTQSGCGMFDLRDPVAPPDRGPDIPNVIPTDPEDVLFNFEEAIKHKLDGMTQYGEALAPDFQLILDQIDFQDLGVDSLNKTRDVAAQRILAGDIPDSLHFAFETKPVELDGAIARYIDIPYELQILSQQDGSLLTTIKGQADLVLLRDEGTLLWSLVRWIDKRLDPFTSFGRWHGERAP